MSTYVVVDSNQQLEQRILELFDSSDKCQANATAWFVRSGRLTASEVVADIGIKAGGPTGIVASYGSIDGVADRRVVQRLGVWESDR